MDKEKQKAILITGTSSGIGYATAKLLAEEGYLVFAGIRKKSDKFKVEKLHKNIRGVYLDITNQDSIDKAFWFVIKQTDKLYALINNAGAAYAGPIELMPIDAVKEQFNLNTFGALALTQKFIPFLKHGRVINISSMASSGVFPFIAPYCASKRALDILFNAFFIENKDDITVVSIKPDVIKTPIWSRAAEIYKKVFEKVNENQKEKYRAEALMLEKQSISNQTKGIVPEDVAKTVLKALKAKNPKTSYFVGAKALWVELYSKLPQKIVNSGVRKLLASRLK